MLERVAQGVFQNEAAQSGIKQDSHLAHIQRHLPPGCQFGRKFFEIDRLQHKLVSARSQLQVRLPVPAPSHCTGQRGSSLSQVRDVNAGVGLLQEHVNVSSCVCHCVLQRVVEDAVGLAGRLGEVGGLEVQQQVIEGIGPEVVVFPSESVSTHLKYAGCNQDWAVEERRWKEKSG